MVRVSAPQLGQPKIIERPRLTKQLDECGARIILLLAPAGYGKTTLARQWLADKPHAWCSLTSASRDVAALALGIASAAREIVPEAGLKMQTRLALSTSPSDELSVFVEMLADDLRKWPGDTWLVLDDYHVLSATPCEAFVRDLANETTLRLLMASRTRPIWATSRSRAYRVHHEIEREDLAMTDEEAAEVVSNPQVLTIAKGWPAVVGLAAALEDREPHTELSSSSALHSFLAEELLKNESPRVRRSLFRLSLCPDMSLEQARTILGFGRVASLVDRSNRLGLISARDGYVIMHPLVKQFIQKWHRARDPNWRSDVELIAEALISHGLWDAAFELTCDLGEESLLEKLVAASLSTMLDEGRHSTIESWLKDGPGGRTSRSPWILFAEAELSSRRGEQQTAEALAAQAARASEDLALAVRAWTLAGRTAQLRDRYRAALDYHAQAQTLATSREETYDAIWGQLVASWQIDPEHASELLADLAGYADSSVDATLRLAGATFQDRLRHGNMTDLEEQLREAFVLATRAKNPVICSSFFATATRWFVLTGRYTEALRAVDRTVRFIEEHRLSFALPSALNIRAMALTGLREWGAASRALAAAEAYAAEFDDIHNQVDANAIRIRMCLSRTDVAGALEAARTTWPRDPGPMELLEYQATCELAYACAAASPAQQRRPPSVSPNADIQTVALAAKAIRSLHSRRGTRAALDDLWTHLLRSGCIDGYVTAYRACPELLARMASLDGFTRFIRPVLREAADGRIARSIDIELPTATKKTLTKREREVHELLAQGLTNREIARLLYVEEVTVKVHVRHILDKLGVRSRVEAATRSDESS